MTVSREETLLADLIHSLTLGDHVNQLQINNFLLKKLTLLDINLLINYTLLEIKELDKKRFETSSMSNIELHQMIKEVIHAFMNWPHNFYNLLDLITDKKKARDLKIRFSRVLGRY
ncbi:hypothetical protein BRE01_34670 [Brevibacillus reuszeri]|uniref:Uncharacterized protein n=1 Tax=Brevibacillus reuszeri TaxID=54915 RepID=A0A0K9YPV5_9BACL|nr:hypothetical protein ADS79_17965 [Brevibacillus reuszeri]GED69765.1 hypothetical protein BRE01_34670 [Brevibacillus reuszeri]